MPVREQAEPGIERQPTPNVPEPVERAAAAFFGALSAARGKRAFHPRGDGFHAEVEVDRPLHRYDGISLLSERGTHDATVRLSRALGLPSLLPDLLGLAVRVHGQDFLLISSGRAALARHLLLPTRGGYGDNTYSSILPYRIGEDVRLVGALPVGNLEFDLTVAPLRGDWTPFARLRIRAAMAHDETERLQFNPWNTGAGLKPIGPMNGLRRSSYAGSQRGRGVA